MARYMKRKLREETSINHNADRKLAISQYIAMRKSRNAYIFDLTLSKISRDKRVGSVIASASCTHLHYKNIENSISKNYVFNRNQTVISL